MTASCLSRMVGWRCEHPRPFLVSTALLRCRTTPGTRVSDLHCPARIIVARHGEAEYETPEMNATGGSLTTVGREQARDLGEQLRSEKVAAVMCSELSRAVQTAEI